MPRQTSDALNARLSAPITQPGYLLRLVPPQGGARIQICDIGTVVNLLGSFMHNDFSMRGAGSANVSVDAQNVDGAIGALVLESDPLGDMEVTLWKFDRSAPDDFVLLGVYLPQSADIGIDRVRLTLKTRDLDYRYAPSKRIIPRDGFNYALRPGDVLLWGAQRIFIEERK